MPAFSIVVPVYNVEKYIVQCLESMLAQTFTDFEIICVDDCGTDNSVEKIRELQKKDSRIKLIQHEQNKKQGGARNTGLRNAKGKYILFIDSDDWLDKECLEFVYNKFIETSYNTIWFKMNVFWEERKEFTNLFFFPYYADYPEGHVIIDENNLTLFPLYNTCIAYNREYLLRNNFFWQENVIFEDVEFYFKVFTNTTEAYIIDKPLYIYRRRESSTIGQAVIDVNKGRQLFKASESTYKYLIKNNLFGRYKNSYLRYIRETINMYRQNPDTMNLLCKDMQEYLKAVGFPEEYYN